MFQFIPKVLDGGKVRALCRPDNVFHNINLSGAVHGSYTNC